MGLGVGGVHLTEVRDTLSMPGSSGSLEASGEKQSYCLETRKLYLLCGKLRAEAAKHLRSKLKCDSKGKK